MMMMNVTVDEILEICPCINNANIEDLNVYEEATDDSEKAWDRYSHILHSGDVSNCNEDIKHLQINFTEMNDRIHKNMNSLEKIEQQMEELTTLRNNLLSTISENKRRLEKIDAKVSNIMKKKENLLPIRDKIQICKLLTSTSFAYKGGNVQGYVIDPISKNLHPFEFSTEKYANSDISNHLYDVLKKASLSIKDPE